MAVLSDLLREKRPRTWVSSIQHAPNPYVVIFWKDFIEAFVKVDANGKIHLGGDEEAVLGVREIIQSAGLGKWLE